MDNIGRKVILIVHIYLTHAERKVQLQYIREHKQKYIYNFFFLSRLGYNIKQTVFSNKKFQFIRNYFQINLDLLYYTQKQLFFFYIRL